MDERFAKAVAAGAKAVRPVMDQFYGDRSGTLEDAFGHVWTIGIHNEELGTDERQKRFEESMQQMGSA